MILKSACCFDENYVPNLISKIYSQDLTQSYNDATTKSLECHYKVLGQIVAVAFYITSKEDTILAPSLPIQQTKIKRHIGGINFTLHS